MKLSQRQIIGITGASGFTGGARWARTRSDEVTTWIDSADSEFVGILFTLAIEHGPGLSEFTLGIQLLFYGLLTYYLLPAVINHDKINIFEDIKIKLTFTAVILAFFLLFTSESDTSLTISDSITNFLLIDLPFVFLIAIAMGLTLYYSQEDPFNPESGHIYNIAMMAQLLEDSGAEIDSQTDKFIGVVGATAVLIVLGMVISWSLMIFDSMFPLLELGVLIVGLLSVLSERIPFYDRNINNVLSNFDVRFIVYFTSIAHNPAKGILLFILISIGIATSVFAQTIALFFGPTMVANIGEGNVRAVILGSSIIIWGVSYGVYLFWFWYRLAKRFPAFMKRSVGKQSSTDVARPTKMLLVPSIFILYFTFVLNPMIYLHDIYPQLQPRVTVTLFLIIGVALLCTVINIWHIYAIRKRDGLSVQPPDNDDKVILGAAFIQSGSYIVTFVVTYFLRFVVGEISTIEELLAEISPVLGFWLFLSVVLYFGVSRLDMADVQNS